MTRAGLSEDERRELLNGRREGGESERDRLARVAADIADARTADLAAQVARVKALADDGSTDSLMETVRRSLVGEAGIWPDRANLATSVVMRDVRDALTAALSPAQPETERGGRP